MGKSKGFLEHKRQPVSHRSVEDRVKDFNEMDLPLTPDDLRSQAARCMDCGIPFCHGAGCPLGNMIPEFNELIYRNKWQQACENLHSTNNFPEFTGRVCPAPCETACTLSINDEPVLIRQIELQIVEKGFDQGWIRPLIADIKTGKKVAVIGSGPAGLAAAQQLARAGHDVTVFEKDERAGGMLRYGIPDFKLDKKNIDRRLEQMAAEGAQFQTGVEVGKDISPSYLERMFDCICLTMGAGKPRDLSIPGREMNNIMFAMHFLSDQNKAVSGEISQNEMKTNAKDMHVVVIGGGDTGSDCVGTSIRQGAKSVTQIEILPKPPETRPTETPWPTWPKIMRTSTSQEEGCQRQWNVMSKDFVGDNTGVKELKCCKVECTNEDGNWKLSEVANSEFTIKADLVLLAMGFVHVMHEGIVNDLDLELDDRGNIIANNGQTSAKNVFAAGDAVSGASLVVRAIDEGRKVAADIDKYLMSE